MGKPRQSPHQGTVTGDADCGHKKTLPAEADRVDAIMLVQRV
jgi:hypothetical protein